MMKDKTAEKKGAQGDNNARKMISVNRRARHEYEIEDTYDAGIVLVGVEVKSLRAAAAELCGFVLPDRERRDLLYNMNITPYEQGNRASTVEAKRKRKLLLHKWQVRELRTKSEQKGLTIVPLALYFQRGFAKLEIALGKGKKLYDKRESIAERDQERETRRQFVNRE